MSRGQTGSADTAQRLLVIGPSNVGDAVLTLDVIAALHHRYPRAHLALVAGRRAGRLFADDPRIRTLLETDRYDSPLGRLRLLGTLLRFHPQIVVDLRQTLYPLALKPHAAWRYLRRPPRSLTHMRDRYQWRLRTQVPGLEAPQPHDGAADGPRPGSAGANGDALWLSKKDATQVDGLCARWSLGQGKRLVIIAPGARSHIKRWTSGGFAEVADRLIAESDAQVVFSGEPEERSVIDEILGLMHHRAVSVVGLTTVRQLGLLMQRSQLVITNDSASLHLASVAGAPTVAIFGPTDPAKYGPTADRSRTIRRALFCSPCERPLCRFSHECMRFLAPEEVYEAAQALLGSEAGQRR